MQQLITKGTEKELSDINFFTSGSFGNSNASPFITVDLSGKSFINCVTSRRDLSFKSIANAQSSLGIVKSTPIPGYLSLPNFSPYLVFGLEPDCPIQLIKDCGLFKASKINPLL